MLHSRMRRPRMTWPRGTVFQTSLWLAAAFAVALIATGASAGSWKGEETRDEAGVLQIMNPATGMEEPTTIELDELWRLGGDSEDEDEFFGVILQIATDTDGNIYVLDSQLSEVKVYDSNGEWTNSIGREGEGPGEFRRPNDMFMLQDGTIGVMQSVPGKIIKLTTTGDPAGDVALPEPEGGGFQMLRGGTTLGDNLLVLAIAPDVPDARLDRIVAIGAELGAQYALAISTEPDSARTVDRFARLCERAAAGGMRLCLEFMRFTAVRTLTDALEVVRSAGHPAGAVLVDMLHLIRSGGAPDDLQGIDPALLPYTQLCDAPAAPADDELATLVDEALNGRVLLGEGGLPVAEILARLPADCSMSCEILSSALRERFPDPAARALAVADATHSFLAHLARQAR